MSSQMSDSELRSHIKKSSTIRLASELGRAQNVIDTDVIETLSRSDLVSYIFCLRRLSGQNDMLKAIVPNFDPAKVTLVTEVEEGAKSKTPSTPLISSQESQFKFFLEERT